MSYESWRITYQDSEQAARDAYAGWMAVRAQLGEMKAKLAQEQRDAGRYQWLRSDLATEPGEPWVITRYRDESLNTDGGTCPLFGAELDAAIDQAMENYSAGN